MTSAARRERPADCRSALLRGVNNSGRHRVLVAMTVGGGIVMVASSVEFAEGDAIHIVIGVALFVSGALSAAFGVLQSRAER
jgi:hypothetical protein